MVTRQPASEGRRKAFLERARVRSEQIRMDATCKIEHKSGEVTNQETGVVSSTYTEVYSGRCQLSDFNAHPSTPELAGQKVTINQPRVLIPVDSSKVEVGARVTVSTCLENPALVGTVLLVTAVRTKGQEKQRALLCDHVQSGTE